jgi:hypothetical protein
MRPNGLIANPSCVRRNLGITIGRLARWRLLRRVARGRSVSASTRRQHGRASDGGAAAEAPRSAKEVRSTGSRYPRWDASPAELIPTTAFLRRCARLQPDKCSLTYRFPCISQCHLHSSVDVSAELPFSLRLASAVTERLPAGSRLATNLGFASGGGPGSGGAQCTGSARISSRSTPGQIPPGVEASRSAGRTSDVSVRGKVRSWVGGFEVVANLSRIRPSANEGERNRDQI